MADTARYALLRNLLRDKILSGEYESGARFFSQNELMKKYGLSFSTVVRALDDLVREGYLVRQQGKGTFVSATTPQSSAGNAPQIKIVTIYAPWGMGFIGGNGYGNLDLPAFFAKMEELQPEGIRLRMVPHPKSAEELERDLFSKEPADAVLSLYPPPDYAAALQRLQKHCPAVVLGSAPCPPPFIQTDYSEATHLATEHLCNAGHKNIGLICPGGTGSFAADCSAGYLSAMRTSQQPFRESRIVHSSPEDANGYHATLALFDNNTDQQITAVIAAGTETLAGVRFALQSMRLEVPRDISLVCIQDYPQSPAAGPPVTCTGFSVSALATAAMENLIAVLSGGPASAVTLPANLVSRSSVAVPVVTR